MLTNRKFCDLCFCSIMRIGMKENSIIVLSVKLFFEATFPLHAFQAAAIFLRHLPQNRK